MDGWRVERPGGWIDGALGPESEAAAVPYKAAVHPEGWL